MISEKSQVRYKSHGSTTNLWYNDNKTKHNKTMTHNDAIKWKPFPRYWSFVRGINRSPVNSPHKGHWRGALMFSLICALNKRFTKQSWGRWFEMPSHSLWRHCNAYFTGDTAQALGRSACCKFSMLWECRLSDIRKPIKKQQHFIPQWSAFISNISIFILMGKIIWKLVCLTLSYIMKLNHISKEYKLCETLR